ncbi:MAG TPA: carbohydrate kinase family protein [Anaerolineae bacterium]|nr:carbohydrate kinase family protein [Anaerolineae bacterium]
MEAPLIVAGHVCLDIIPTLPDAQARLSDLLPPGGMLQVGPVVLSTGGAVPNTGLALHRLGVPVRLMGKVADDGFGRVILDILRGYDPALADGMLVAPGEHSSYTVILSAPGLDRTFLHYPGPNDTFCAADVPDAGLDGARLFHFGYPPLMRRMYLDDGRELETLFRRVRARGLVTSLDLTRPDPDSEAGRVDWPALLARALPHVDVFLPSLEELFFMLDRAQFLALERTAGARGIIAQVDGDFLSTLGQRLLDLGVAIAGLKLGDQGIYLRTTGDAARLAPLAAALGLDARAWANRELLAPTFRAHLVGATGAGDCAVAGFLAGLLHWRTPEPTLVSAVAVGACNVEAADAVSGVPAWEAVQARVQAGWEQLPVTLNLRGWGWDAGRGVWNGPRDRGGQLC